MNRRKLKTIGLLAAMFLLGAVTGAAGMRAADNRDLAVMLDAPPVEARQRMRLRALARKLGLSDAQKRSIAEVLREERARCAPLQARVDEQLADCREQSQAAVSKVLTPQQRAQWELIVERRARRARPPAR